MHTQAYMNRLGLLSIGAIALGSMIACSPEASDDASSQGSEIGEREDLYDKSEALDMTIEVPLTTLFTRFKAGQADPKPADKPNAQPEFSEPAKIVVPNADGKGTAKTFDARIGIRGESSKRDCPFPKLKVDFTDKEALKGTLFKGHSTVRINTHCGPGDANARSGMGRIQNGVGPAREELVYRLIRAADVPTYFTRVGKIHYEDTAGGAQSADSYAMLFESGDDAAQRFVKAKLIEAEAKYLDQKAGEVKGTATPENMAKIIVTEALAGNRDFFGTHNIDTFGLVGAATVFQIPQDFDLCAITTANAPNWTGAITAASKGLTDPAIVTHFANHKADMDAAIQKAEKDGIAAGVLPSDDGKTTTDPGFKAARERVEALFQLPELKGK